jgi:hypothetical protein
MHTEETVLAGTDARPPGAPPLTAVVPVVPKTPADPASPGAITLPVVGSEPDEPGLSVHYALDQASQRWVASILDARSGEVVCTVPSTQVLHLIAALRRSPLDVRA